MKHILYSLLLGFGLSTPLPATEQGEPRNSELVTTLENEFKQAYPEKAMANGIIRSFEITAKEAEWALFPPYKTRVWSYEGSVPAPVMRIKLGETIQLKLNNQLPQDTSVHWHGIRVPNAMDGVPGVTQPAIKSGESFVYEFTPKDAGTFWFHPHVNAAEQVERGLHGVLVVEDPDGPEYSKDIVWVLDDWLLEKDAQIYSQFVTRHDLAHDGRWGNLMTVNGEYQPRFKVRAGERIRLRLVNVANGRVFLPSFAKLSPLVIAVDGMLAKVAFPLERFYLAPGNRIDLDITIPKDAAGQRFEVKDIFSREERILAFLQVTSDEAVKTPTFEPPKAAHFPEWKDAVKTPVSHDFVLNAKRGGEHGIAWTIDGEAWPKGETFKLKAGQFTRLRISNRSPRLHPMHLHGQFFKRIAVDGKPVEENYWRDTVLIGPRESVDIALIPLDKGAWAHHCHILEHAEAGMMGIIEVK